MLSSHRLVPTLPLLALLAGCGGDLMAPEGAASNAFLNKVAGACGNLSIGTQPINYLLDISNDDVTFLDETAKLGTGEIDPDTYREAINGFYPTGNNEPAIDCVIAQLR
ncbi:MAG: hypothetical protein PVJ47_10255 [Thiohalocapsa sp.]|jgi:hypothetical protein|uniref:hypothetical protein n=1 Tax=Thiohalocapsa sp. TaxID=2497641 RepID=UPI0025EF740E|nr:hypothetical protein [Thiohalocapsa sp.]